MVLLHTGALETVIPAVRAKFLDSCNITLPTERHFNQIVLFYWLKWTMNLFFSLTKYNDAMTCIVYLQYDWFPIIEFMEILYCYNSLNDDYLIIQFDIFIKQHTLDNIFCKISTVVSIFQSPKAYYLPVMSKGGKPLTWLLSFWRFWFSSYNDLYTLSVYDMPMCYKRAVNQRQRLIWSFWIYGFDRKLQLTHWSRATQICDGKLTNIVSDNGLSHGRWQAII